MDVELDLQDPEQYDLHAKLKETDTPEGLALSDELKETVERAIAALPEDLRTAIILRELEGMSYEEIAETMDCPVGTVRSRIFRARDAIGRASRYLRARQSSITRSLRSSVESSAASSFCRSVVAFRNREINARASRASQ